MPLPAASNAPSEEETPTQYLPAVVQRLVNFDLDARPFGEACLADFHRNILMTVAI